MSKINSELLSCNELKDLSLKFADFYQRFVEELEYGYILDGEYVSEPDIEIIHESQEILDMAEDFFELDVSDGSYKLEELSKKLSKKSQNYEEDNTDWIDRKLRQDDEIESLFNALRDTL